MTKFIAEFTTNHMGNLNVLLEMVRKAKQAGADFIKMQKKDVETYYSKDKLDSEFLSPYGKTYRDYRKIFEFNKEDFDRFDLECKENKIRWFSTVQDIPSLDFMLNYNLPKYKISSSSARDFTFIGEVAKQLPYSAEIVLSVGGSTLDQIEKALNILSGKKVTILHCVSTYPVKISRLRLGNIDILKTNFETSKVKIGYSGHEVGIVPSVVVAKLYKPALIERHFCLSKHSFVHHIDCSLEPDEFGQMIKESKDPEINYNLPTSAFESSFGMTDQEKDFLIKQSYAKNYLGKSSIWSD